MKVDKKQVMQTVNVYIADDGKEFASAIECKEYEYDRAVIHATLRFDFKFTDSYEDEFTLVYKEDYVNEFATDLSFIINNRWDVDSTNMAGEYDRDTIMHSLETDLCEKFIDGHTYKFSGYSSYTDDDHPDDFCMDIDDITEDETKKQDSPKQKDMIEEERQVLKDRLKYVRDKMMIYSNTACDAYLALAKEEKEITDKLGDLVLNYSGPFSAESLISTFIVNQLGINLVAVKDIQVDRQSDGQIKQIKIDFIPDNKA